MDKQNNEQQKMKNKLINNAHFVLIKYVISNEIEASIDRPIGKANKRSYLNDMNKLLPM